MSERRIEYVRLDEVQTADRNAKLHDEAGISRAISHHGFVEVPARDERTGKLVAGHGRYEQLLRMMRDGESAPDGIEVDGDGMWRMPLLAGWSSRSDIDAETYLIGSNELSKKGGNDEFTLTEMLADQAAYNLIELTGFDTGDLEALEALYAPTPTVLPGAGGFDDADHVDDELDALDQALGDGKSTDLLPVLKIRVPQMLVESWKAYLDTHGGDEVQAFASLLDVDPADLPA
jgi:hypothetical protein